VKKTEIPPPRPAAPQQRPAAGAVRAEPVPAEKAQPAVPEKGREPGLEKGGNGQDKGQGAPASAGQDATHSGDYQAIIEMARKGMSESEIIEKSELTEAEISLVLELGRKRNEFN